MKKIVILLFLFLLTLGLVTGYVYLTKEVTSGDAKISAGQKQLEEGEQMLTRGKAKLADGQRRLSGAKNTYRKIKGIPFMGIMDKLPISGEVFNIAHSKIAEGDLLVARGKEKIKNGEAQLAAGKLELIHGEKRLAQANKLRIACGIGALFFALVFIFLGFYWRQSLRKLFKRC